MRHDRQRRFILAGLQFLQEAQDLARDEYAPMAFASLFACSPPHCLREPRERFGVLLGLKKEDDIQP